MPYPRRQRFDFLVMALLVIALLAQPVVAPRFFQQASAATLPVVVAGHTSSCDIPAQPAPPEDSCCNEQRQPSGDCTDNQCACPDGILGATAMTFAPVPLGLLSLPTITMPENIDNWHAKRGSPPPIRPPIRA